MHGFTIAFVFSECMMHLMWYHGLTESVWWNQTNQQNRRKKNQFPLWTSCVIEKNLGVKLKMYAKESINTQLNELLWITFTGTTLDTHAISFQELPAHQFG